ncbi:MAG: hypothetical protein JW991_02765 [Candidatus Pacebacteria bacterium]|nr:hypothetical protein [Candidatus Paceibacterota bacterium]
MHAFLITGADAPTRLAKAQNIIEKIQKKPIKNFRQNPDVFIIESDDSIKISQIRNLKKKLFYKPLALKLKAGLIYGAEKLTLPAQNALLKTLEEPPADTILILTSRQAESLLPTILSRVQIIKLPPGQTTDFFSDKLSENLKIIHQALFLSPGEKLQLTAKLAVDKKEAPEFILGQLHAWRQILLAGLEEKQNPDKFKDFKELFPSLTVSRTAILIKKINKAYQLIDKNVNHRLVIDNLFLRYPQITSRKRNLADKEVLPMDKGGKGIGRR